MQEIYAGDRATARVLGLLTGQSPGFLSQGSAVRGGVGGSLDGAPAIF